MNTPKLNPETDLKFERTIDVPRNKIWEAWTNPELLKEWFCPRPWKVTECDIDLRVGGKFRTLMKGPEGEEFNNLGCILEIIPGEKLVTTDALHPDFRPTGAGFMTMHLVLEDYQGGTKYTAYVLHKDAEAKAQHEAMGFEQGWGAAFNQLVELIKSR